MRSVDVAILELLAESGLRFTPKVIAVNTDYTRNYVSRRCAKLKEAGLIFKDEKRTYALTDFGKRVLAESIPPEKIKEEAPQTYEGEMREGQPDPVFAETVPLQTRVNFIERDIDEFTWGYIGQGPLQLAYALLGDVRDGVIAEKYASEYMHDVIALLDAEWKLPRAEIEAWLDRQDE